MPRREPRGHGCGRGAGPGLLLTALTLTLAWGPARLAAQQVPASGRAPTPIFTQVPVLVLDRVTVIDVVTGAVRSDQRVVIADRQIRAVGAAAEVDLPRPARVIDAHGQYLIPGLWDMHAHPVNQMEFAYPLYIANGVTGIRHAGTGGSLDTVHRWRREILAGTRVGPPRQLVTGPSLDQGDADVVDPPDSPNRHVATPEAARRAVDSLQAAGADFVKVHYLGRELFFAVAAAARRRGLPFSGHLAEGVTVGEAADSGQRALDHLYSLPPECVGDSASVARCRPLVARLRRTATWLIPTAELIRLFLPSLDGPQLRARLRYLPDSVSRRHWPADSGVGSPGGFLDNLARSASHPGDGPRAEVLTILRQSGGDALVLAGTDVGAGAGAIFPLMPGFSLHDQLVKLVAAGLSPLGALRAATLHPAQFSRATDSLGTIAVGKLADLVLLDADPLADIHNTTKIRAVVANGRYYDRAALDALLAQLEQAGDARWR